MGLSTGDMKTDKLRNFLDFLVEARTAREEEGSPKITIDLIFSLTLDLETKLIGVRLFFTLLFSILQFSVIGQVFKNTYNF